MGAAVRPSLEECVKRKWDVYVVYEEETKDIVDYHPFGKINAETSCSARNSKYGPLTHNFAKWDRYLFILDQHEKHLAQLAEIETRL
jgi:hypothetical protein